MTLTATPVERHAESPEAGARFATEMKGLDRSSKKIDAELQPSDRSGHRRVGTGWRVRRLRQGVCERRAVSDGKDREQARRAPHRAAALNIAALARSTVGPGWGDRRRLPLRDRSSNISVEQ